MPSKGVCPLWRLANPARLKCIKSAGDPASVFVMDRDTRFRVPAPSVRSGRAIVYLSAWRRIDVAGVSPQSRLASELTYDHREPR